MSDEGENSEGFGSGYSWASLDPSEFDAIYGLYSSPKLVSPADKLSPTYDKIAGSLEASISASAAPYNNNNAGNLTEFVGVSGAAVTPVGGAEINVGLYSDSSGMVGAFFSIGPTMGLPGGSLGVVAGHATSLSGNSVSASAGLSYGFVGVSKGYSTNPSTGNVTGEYWGAGLTVGPPVSASGAFTSTSTSEFTSLYLAYIQFLNWSGYPGNTAQGNPGF